MNGTIHTKILHLNSKLLQRQLITCTKLASYSKNSKPNKIQDKLSIDLTR